MISALCIHNKRVVADSVKEEFRFLVSKDFGKSVPNLKLTAGETSDEVLHPTQWIKHTIRDSNNDTHSIQPPSPAPRKMISLP